MELTHSDATARVVGVARHSSPLAGRAGVVRRSSPLRMLSAPPNSKDAELRRPAAAHEAALRAVQKPPAKPWRGGGAASTPPPPPKVYRVEPREFRDLVQRLTGAPGSGVARPQHHQLPAAVQPHQPVAVRATGDHQQQLYGSPWFSFPLAGVDGANAGGLM